jgi:hypothetical protein
MHSAPSVTVTADNNGRWRQARRSLCLGVAAVALAWMVQRAWYGLGGWAALACGTFSLAMLLLAWREVHRPPSRLHWDGLQWWWSPSITGPNPVDGLPGQIQVCIDTGGWMLLRFSPSSAASPFWRPTDGHWLTLAATDQPARWHGLRCAVYSSRRMSRTQPDAPTATLTPHP